MKGSKLLPVAVIVIVLAAAFGYYFFVTPSQMAQKALERVDAILSFVPQGDFVPIYVGVDQGFFAKYGLQVNILPNPQGSTGAVRALAGKRADFAVNTDVGTLVSLRAKENITNVRAIATYYSENPMGIQYVIGKSISAPKDLEGKTVGSFPGDSAPFMLPVFCKATGIDCGKVNIQNVSPTTLNSGLLTGKFDAILRYRINVADLQPEAAKAGLKVGNFAFADYGVNVYANMILTRTDVISSNPDMVKRFVQGFEEALQFSVAHPDEAVGSILKFNPQLNTNVTRGEWEIVAQQMGGKAILNAKDPLVNGWIDPARMNTTITIVSATRDMPAPNPSEVYTDQFVKQP